MNTNAVIKNLEEVITVVSPPRKEVEMMIVIAEVLGMPTLLNRHFMMYTHDEYGKQSKNLFVAHMDHMCYDENEEITPYEKDGVIFSLENKSPIGLDDKVGLAIGMTLFQERVPIDILFTCCEEIGGIGAKAFRNWHHETNMRRYETIISADRRGYGGYTKTILGTRVTGSELERKLEAMGLHPVDGNFCDLYQLMDIGHNLVNLECGYYNPHQANEYAVLREILATYDNIKEVIK